MRSEKPRRFKLVDDKDPIWNWIIAILLLAIMGVIFIGYLIYKAFD